MPGVTDQQIRGMLLEEAILYLLRHSGYRTVDEAGNDPTLANHVAGLAVRGRGEKHQIDAIADFFVSPPFGHPLRLLLEAKFYTTKIGMPTIRNAVGVLKDVSEFWVTPRGNQAIERRVPHRRYHYQYAVFTPTGYTSDAQRYAFAHDIFLIPLANSAFFRPVVDAISAVTKASFRTQADEDRFLSRLRSAIRKALRSQHVLVEDDDEGLVEPTVALLNAVRRIGSAYLAVIGGYLPVFLVPSPEWQQGMGRELQVTTVTITFDDNGWYINDGGTRIFSFDLPRELLAVYRENNVLTAQGALDLKREVFKNIEIFDTRNEVPRIFWLRIDTNWLDRIERRNQARANRPRPSDSP